MLCGVCGLLPYLYLPMQYHLFSFGPYVNWGDVMSLSGFFHHFVRADYGTFQLASDQLTADISYSDRISVFLHTSLQEMHSVCAAAFFGAFFSIASHLRFLVPFRKSTPRDANASISPLLLLFLSCTWVTYTLVFCYLSNLDLKGLLWGVHARFTMQTNVVIALAGSAFIQLLLLHKQPRRRTLILSSVIVLVWTASLCVSVNTT